MEMPAASRNEMGMEVQELNKTLMIFRQIEPLLYTIGRSHGCGDEEIARILFNCIFTLHDKKEKHGRDKDRHALIALFMKECRGIARQVEGEEIPSVISRMNESEREAVLLVYGAGLSIGAVSSVMKKPEDEVKEDLLRGIRFIREHPDVEGCPEYHRLYVDYLERSIERTEKVAFEMHIHQCPGCQEDLATFQETLLELREFFEQSQVPEGFRLKLDGRIDTELETRKKKNKKRKRTGIIALIAAFLLLFTGFVTDGFASIYYTYADWKNDEDLLLREFYQSGIGERLNLTAEDNGVKITIKTAIADEIQTLVYYEIEDMEKDRRLMVDTENGFTIENQIDFLNGEGRGIFMEEGKSEEGNVEEKNIHKGSFSLPPIVDDVEDPLIKLSFTQLIAMSPDMKSTMEVYATNAIEEMERTRGVWEFEIPVEKQESRVMKLGQEIEVEGLPVRLDEVIIAPTTTALTYSIREGQEEPSSIFHLLFDSIKTKEKAASLNWLSWPTFLEDYNDGWSAYRQNFDSLYFEELKEPELVFSTLQMHVPEQLKFKIDFTKPFPQVHEYGGGTILVEEPPKDRPGEVTMKMPLTDSRDFDTVSIMSKEEFEGEGDFRNDGEMESVYLDRNGKEFEEEDWDYEEVMKGNYPRSLTVKQSFKMFKQGKPAPDLIPTEFIIDGYEKTVFLDQSVPLKFKNK
ncbi:DUF4179 domain-containing protein [Rossellomorea marisflavi]|uniref:DUF4179 domain-containing protein n=1 Tax=Rossellomorea marisflavi TaxID=189381 RepID=UPI0011E815B8|nr:DUF4179 domain-containing protein [Rossellomorea marisflavi]TYO71285.1 DUF4179 domain-containing protein [Rossellomorea marisflavi]